MATSQLMPWYVAGGKRLTHVAGQRLGMQRLRERVERRDRMTDGQRELRAPAATEGVFDAEHDVSKLTCSKPADAIVPGLQ